MAMAPFFHLASSCAFPRKEDVFLWLFLDLRLQFHNIYMMLRSRLGCGDSFALDAICVRWLIPSRRPLALAIVSLRWCIAAPTSSERVRRRDDNIPDFKFGAFTTTHT
jgi:hypothetical protein